MSLSYEPALRHQMRWAIKRALGKDPYLKTSDLKASEEKEWDGISSEKFRAIEPAPYSPEELNMEEEYLRDLQTSVDNSIPLLAEKRDKRRELVGKEKRFRMNVARVLGPTVLYDIIFGKAYFDQMATGGVTSVDPNIDLAIQATNGFIWGVVGASQLVDKVLFDRPISKLDREIRVLNGTANSTNNFEKGEESKMVSYLGENIRWERAPLVNDTLVKRLV